MRLILIAGLLFILTRGFAQNTATVPPDTILLNNGRMVISQITDTVGTEVTVIKPHSRRHKKIGIGKESIFSIKYGSTGKEEIYYIYDTLTDHDYTVDEARKFIAGEQDAQQGYHAAGVSAAAFAVGFLSGASLGSVISFGPPFLFTGLMTYPRIRVRHKSVKDKSNATSDAYLRGYDVTARRKRTLRSLLWGGVGLIGGLAAHFTVLVK